MNNTSFLFILTNCVAAVNLLLVIYSSLLIQKHDYIVVQIVSMSLNLIVYALGFCWSSVIMIVNVIQDLFLIFLPLIEFYLEIIKKRTGGAFVSKGNNIVLPKL